MFPPVESKRLSRRFRSSSLGILLHLEMAHSAVPSPPPPSVPKVWIKSSVPLWLHSFFAIQEIEEVHDFPNLNHMTPKRVG